MVHLANAEEASIAVATRYASECKAIQHWLQISLSSAKPGGGGADPESVSVIAATVRAA